MSRAQTIAARIGRFVATLLIVTFFTALLLDFVPGDPAAYLAGDGATPETIATVREQYGFDDPFLTRYWHWLTGVLHGDFGTSYVTKQPVLDSIMERLPVTVELAVLAMIVALAVSIPLAVSTAYRANGPYDRVMAAGSYAVISVPSFVIALVLTYFFAYRWQLFPIFGWTRLTENPAENLRSAVLPVLSIAAGTSVVLYRVFRADLTQILQEDYISLARAKGASPRRVMWRHAVKPASFSLLTLSALQLAAFLGGTVVVEQIFQLPGIGSLLLSSIQARDLVVVQGIVLFIAVVFLIVNLLVDLLYGLLDPRVRIKAAR